MSSINVRGHGSLVNAIYAQMKDGFPPTVGTPCTILSWTDRSPAVIAAVSPSGSTIWVRDLHSTPEPGHCNAFTESQRWVIGEAYGEAVAYTLRRNGKFVRKGSPMQGGGGLLIGRAERYVDPSF